jgi:GDP-L-fucose synthase
MRDFLYVDDMAEASLFVYTLNHTTYTENTKSVLSHINVGTGVDVTIKELAQTVKEVVGFNGEIIFDTSKPDGTMRKLMDVSTLRKLGYVAPTSLRSGLELAYADFLKNSSKLGM